MRFVVKISGNAMLLVFYSREWYARNNPDFVSTDPYLPYSWQILLYNHEISCVPKEDA